MYLSRLENFLKNAEGNILYVNPSDFDATDSIENRGNSQTRPFKTIQRALIEVTAVSLIRRVKIMTKSTEQLFWFFLTFTTLITDQDIL